MAKLILNWSEVYTEVSEFLGLGSSPGATDLATVKAIVSRGLRRFYYSIDAGTRQPHVWSFLKKYHSLSTIADSWKYALPSDYSEMITKPSFGESTGYLPLKQRDPQQIIEKRVGSLSTGYPIYYAIAPVTFDDETGTYYEFWVYPTPSGVHQLRFWYKIDPLEPTETTDFFPGGVKSVEAILENCLAVAEQQEDDVVGLHSQLATQLTQDLIIIDKRPTTDRIGNLYGQVEPWPGQRNDYFTATDADIYEDNR